ncbi:MAG: hypothetical protein V2I50_11045 [Desulfuromusa sp.]|jgi:flavorubredoxin|nr:hypothetical protein [Desulfuromusa sp.]
MKPRRIKDNIHWMGYVDWDARLFDQLIPLPDGTSYNGSLIEEREGTMLIDTVKPEFFGELEEQLENVSKVNQGKRQPGNEKWAA